MALEIERRFLVNINNLPDFSEGVTFYDIVQGYLTKPENNSVVRVRTTCCNKKLQHGYITIKTDVSKGINKEFEYEIPFEDANELLMSCGDRLIIKKRVLLYQNEKHIWEVDFFGGELNGIVLAEIELSDIEELIEIPDFIDKEITGIKELSNFKMALYPNIARDIINDFRKI